MLRILLKSNKIYRRNPSGGQFFSAFDTIRALFRSIDETNRQDIAIGVWFDRADDSVFRTHLRVPYFRHGSVVYPASRTNPNRNWDFIHYLTEDLIYSDLFLKRVLFHVRGIQDWVIHDRFSERTKYRRHLFVKYLSRLCHSYIAPSTYLRNALVEHYGFDSGAVKVVPNGYDADLFVPWDREEAAAYLGERYGMAPERPFCLHVSDFSRSKGMGSVLAAFREVCMSHDVDLVLVGGRSPALIDYWRSRAQALDLGGRVIFVGSVPQADLAKFYSAARLFLFPSVNDSFGKPVLEAMACGCPVIVSTTAGVSDVVPDPDLLAGADEIDRMADVMSRLLRDGDLNARLRGRMTAAAAGLSWNQVAGKLIDHYLHEGESL